MPANLDKLSDVDRWHLLGGLRGPDVAVNTYTGRVVKSVTSLLVREAVYGWEIAEGFSSPTYPMFERFYKLDMKDIAKLGSHFLRHAYLALGIILYQNLLPSYDQDIQRVRSKLNDACDLLHWEK